jgi:very-short-patch-repair endonuclease
MQTGMIKGHNGAQTRRGEVNMKYESRHIVKFQTVTEGKRTASRQLRQSMTEAEVWLWNSLRNSALGVKFRRQQVIQGFIGDFYCDSAGLIVEADGSVHLENPENDQERDAILTAHGLCILHFTNEEILNDTPRVLEEIRRAIHLTP